MGASTSERDAKALLGLRIAVALYILVIFGVATYSYIQGETHLLGPPQNLSLLLLLFVALPASVLAVPFTSVVDLGAQYSYAIVAIFGALQGLVAYALLRKLRLRRRQ